MPLYSDPYFDYDFNNRAETMDWIDFLISGTDTSDDDDVTTISSYTWNLNGSYTVKLPDIVKPYISSLSLSSFKSSIVFSSRTNTDLTNRDEYNADKYWKDYTPERYFYYRARLLLLA